MAGRFACVLRGLAMEDLQSTNHSLRPHHLESMAFTAPPWAMAVRAALCTSALPFPQNNFGSAKMIWRCKIIFSMTT